MRHADMSAATRAALIERFCSIYSTEPLERITVKEISGGAGVSRVTFYNYFQDPYDLLNRIEDEFISALMRTIQTTFDEGFDPDAFFECFVKSTEKNAPLMRVLLAGSHAGVFAEKLKSAALPVVRSNLNADLDDPQTRYAIEYHVAGMVALLKQWLLVGDIIAEEMATCVRKLLTEGVLATIRR